MSNASLLMASRLTVALFGWCGTILIIRHLTVNQWGEFTFVFSFLSLVAIVTNVANARVAVLGMIGAEDLGAYAGTYVLLRFVLGVVGYGFAVTFVISNGYNTEVIRATLIAGLVVVVATTSGACDAAFQLRARLGPLAAANVAGQSAQMGLTVILAVQGGSLTLFTIPAVLCELVILIWKMWAVTTMFQLRFRVMLAEWLALLRTGVPYAVGSALAMIYYSIDTVMLSRMTSFQAVGIYGIAYKFAGIAHFVPEALGAAVIAPLVRSWAHQRDLFWARLNRATLVLALLAVPILFEMTLFGRQIITGLYGGTYAQADTATALVVAGECVGFFSSLAVITLVSMNRNFFYPVVCLVGVVVNVGLNLVIIPRLSYTGAAVDTLLTELVVCGLLWIPIRRAPGRQPLPLRAMALASSAGVVCGTVSRLATVVLSWPLAATLGAAGYMSIIHFRRLTGPRGLRELFIDPEAISIEPLVQPGAAQPGP
ncbi:MAG: polysaccharide biosynthesis protein HsfF [Acidimicrobiales bacterium]